MLRSALRTAVRPRPIFTIVTVPPSRFLPIRYMGGGAHGGGGGGGGAHGDNTGHGSGSHGGAGGHGGHQVSYDDVRKAYFWMWCTIPLVVVQTAFTALKEKEHIEHHEEHYHASVMYPYRRYYEHDFPWGGDNMHCNMLLIGCANEGYKKIQEKVNEETAKYGDVFNPSPWFSRGVPNRNPKAVAAPVEANEEGHDQHAEEAPKKKKKAKKEKPAAH